MFFHIHGFLNIQDVQTVIEAHNSKALIIIDYAGIGEEFEVAVKCNTKPENIFDINGEICEWTQSNFAIRNGNKSPENIKNKYKCDHCGYVGPCYGIPTSDVNVPISAPWCYQCGKNDRLTQID